MVGNLLVSDARDYLYSNVNGEYNTRSLDAIQRISIHHSAGRFDALDVASELAEMRKIRDLHLNNKERWPGHAYHFDIFPSGRIYYTGDILTSRFVVGKGNTSNVAFCLIGLFMGDVIPTDAALWSCFNLVENFKLAMNRADYIVSGHKETPGTLPTACPGEKWLEWKHRIVIDTSEAVNRPISSEVVSLSESEWERIARDEAEALGLPRDIGAALLDAEGGFNPHATRFGHPDGSDETEYALNLMALIEELGIDSVGNWTGDEKRPMTGRQAWDEMIARTWPDVSFGGAQITVQHADAFGDGTGSYENVKAFRDWTLSDPRASIQWAMRYLASKYRAGEDDAMFKALARYNYPRGDGRAANAGVERNYRAALARASRR